MATNNYLTALEKLMKKYELENNAADSLVKAEDVRTARSTSNLATLADNLQRSQALIGSVGGRPTEVTTNFKQFGDNALRELNEDKQEQQIKKAAAIQNLALGRDSIKGEMQIDKFGQDKQLADLQLQHGKKGLLLSDLQLKKGEQDIKQGNLAYSKMQQDISNGQLDTQLKKLQLSDAESERNYSPTAALARVSALNTQKKFSQQNGDMASVSTIDSQLKDLVQADTIYRTAQQLRQSGEIEKAKVLEAKLNSMQLSFRKAKQAESLEAPAFDLIKADFASKQKAIASSPQYLANKEAVTDIAKANVKKLAIKNQIDSYSQEMQAALQSGDQKTALEIGNRMLKVLNSTEGADAIGKEEAERLGSQLKIINTQGTGRFGYFGRDLSGFLKSAKSTSDAISGGIKANQKISDDISNTGSSNTFKNLGTPQKISSQDLEAFNWARANPSDARAAKIILKLQGQLQVADGF